jgi:hypothetical protein
MTREKLEEVYLLNKELEMWKQRRKNIHMSINSQVKILDGMPHSQTNVVKKPVEDAAVRISTDLARIDKKISEQIRKIEAAKIEVEEYILTINRPLLRMIVEYRCVQNMTWREIGKKVNYDASAARRKYMSFLYSLPAK